MAILLPDVSSVLISTDLCQVANTKGWEFACGKTIIEGIIDYSKGLVPKSQALENAMNAKKDLCSKCKFCSICCSYAGVLTAGNLLDLTQQQTEMGLPIIFTPGMYS